MKSLLFVSATVLIALLASSAITAIAEDVRQCTLTATYCWSCSGNATSSTYKQNVDTLLGSLNSTNQANYGFLNMSMGNGTNKVNLMALCRGDLDENECQNCYGQATMLLSQNCTDNRQAIIWAEGCTVRYSNETIYGIEEDEPQLFLWSPASVSNAADFKVVLNPLLKALVQNASSGDSSKKFAAGHAPVPSGSATNQTIYAAVQCSPELDMKTCSDCLEDSIEDVPKCCDGKDGARILKPSCLLRFERGIFYNPAADTLVNIPEAPTASPTPTPTPTTPTPTTSPTPTAPTPTTSPTPPAPTTPTPTTSPTPPTTPAPTTTEGNTTSNLTVRVSPSSFFFQLLVLVLCLLSALALF